MIVARSPAARRLVWLTVTVLCLLGSSSPLHAQMADVVTWWNAPQDKAALSYVIQGFEGDGSHWQGTEIFDDMSAQTYVTARIIAGEPPIAAQWIDGATLRRLVNAQSLRPINEPDWPRFLPPLVLKTLAVAGGYIAAPTGFRSRNWIWLNLALFKKAGIAVGPEWPQSWDDVNEAARQFRKSGIQPFAIGGDPWQQLLTLEMVVAGIGGLDFYRRAMIDMDDAALGSPVMLAAFEEMQILGEFATVGTPADAPSLPIDMLARGEVAMDIMGDWQKSIMENVGLVLGRDFDCVPVPGTRDFSIVNIEMFVFPRNEAAGAASQQKRLADLLIDPDTQQKLNQIRGLTPTRLDVSPDTFDKCTSHLMANAHRPDGLSVGSVRSMPRALVDLSGAAVATFLANHLTPEEGVALFRRTIAANR